MYRYSLLVYLGWVDGGKSCPMYYMMIYYIAAKISRIFVYEIDLETCFKKGTGVRIPILYIM